MLGEVGRYFVQCVAESAVTGDELRSWCVERVADYKVPREFVFVDSFPLTPAGKIQKSSLPRD